MANNEVHQGLWIDHSRSSTVLGATVTLGMQPEKQNENTRQGEQPHMELKPNQNVFCHLRDMLIRCDARCEHQ